MPEVVLGHVRKHVLKPVLKPVAKQESILSKSEFLSKLVPNDPKPWFCKRK